MTSTDILSAQGLTKEQIESETLRIMPIIESIGDEARDILYFAYSGHDSKAIANLIKASRASDVESRLTKLRGRLQLTCPQESTDAQAIVLGALTRVDEAGKKPSPPPSPKPVEPVAPATPDFETLVLEASAKIEVLEDADLVLLVSFENGGDLPEELLSQLGLGNLPVEAASRVLREAYDCAGKPTPAIQEEAAEEVAEVVSEAEPEIQVEPDPIQPTSTEEPSASERLGTAAARIPGLPPRQLSILPYLAVGLKNDRIARQLNVTTKIVEVAVSALYKFLDVPNCGSTLTEQRKFKRDFVTQAYNLYKQATGTPPVVVDEEVQTSGTEILPLEEGDTSGEIASVISPDVLEPPAVPVVEETVTTNPSNTVAGKIANLSARRLQFLQDAAGGLSNGQIGDLRKTDPHNVDTTLRQTWNVLKSTSEDNTNWRQRLIDLYLANGGERDDPAPQEPEAQTIEQPGPIVAGPQETPAHDDEAQVEPVVEPGPTPTEALANEALTLEHEDTSAEVPEEPEPSHQQPELVINPELLSQAEQFLEIGIVMLEAGLAEIRRRKLKIPDQV